MCTNVFDLTEMWSMDVTGHKGTESIFSYAYQFGLLRFSAKSAYFGYQCLPKSQFAKSITWPTNFF